MASARTTVRVSSGKQGLPGVSWRLRVPRGSRVVGGLGVTGVSRRKPDLRRMRWKAVFPWTEDAGKARTSAAEAGMAGVGRCPDLSEWHLPPLVLLLPVRPSLMLGLLPPE